MMSTNKFFFGLFYLGIFTLIILFSCQTTDSNAPDVVDIGVDFKTIHFEDLLFGLDSNMIAQELGELETSHPAFVNLFFESILPLTDKSGSINEQELIGFINDPFLINLKDTLDQVFDRSAIRSEFEKAFKYAKHYFPNWNTPNIYTLISGFAYQRFLFEDEDGDALGVGLDFFLGSNYPYKQIDPSNPSYSDYLTRTFNEDHIIKKSLEAWIEDKMPPMTSNNLISQMISNGKKLYILDKLLPAVSDTVIMEYTADQLAWSHESELEIWSFFFDQDLFYETNLRKISKYINPSPSSLGMPPEAPGRIANYMGWRIVEAYMKRHPEKSLEMLLLERNAQQILDASKYKPKKK